MVAILSWPQCVNWSLEDKFLWILDMNKTIFIQENWFGNVICKMAAIWSWIQWISELILGLHSANERHRYKVTPAICTPRISSGLIPPFLTRVRSSCGWTCSPWTCLPQGHQLTYRQGNPRATSFVSLSGTRMTLCWKMTHSSRVKRWVISTWKDGSRAQRIYRARISIIGKWWIPGVKSTKLLLVYRQTSNISHNISQKLNVSRLVSSCSCLCPLHWSQLLSREWRCSWSSTDRWCSNYMYIRVIINFVAYLRCRLY